MNGDSQSNQKHAINVTSLVPSGPPQDKQQQQRLLESVCSPLTTGSPRLYYPLPRGAAPAAGVELVLHLVLHLGLGLGLGLG